MCRQLCHGLTVGPPAKDRPLCVAAVWGPYHVIWSNYDELILPHIKRSSYDIYTVRYLSLVKVAKLDYYGLTKCYCIEQEIDRN